MAEKGVEEQVLAMERLRTIYVKDTFEKVLQYFIIEAASIV